MNHILIFAGTGLTTVGLLYFIGIKMLSDRFQAILALIAGLLLAIGGEFALTASSVSFYKAQQRESAVCELEGEAAHPAEQRSDPTKIIFTHIVGCMKAAGYEWTTAHKHCQEAPRASNPFCYLPSAILPRAVTWAQMQFE
jgi:hypothetical protein